MLLLHETNNVLSIIYSIDNDFALFWLGLVTLLLLGSRAPLAVKLGGGRGPQLTPSNFWAGINQLLTAAAPDRPGGGALYIGLLSFEKPSHHPFLEKI